MTARIPSRPDGPPPALKRLERRARRDALELELDRFKSRKPWRVTRAAYLREHPLCERCKAGGRHVGATVVHHKVDRRERLDLALEPDNLEALCVSCHNAETARRKARRL